MHPPGTAKTASLVPASTTEAIDMILAGLRYLAATDPTTMPSPARAEFL